MTRQFCREKQGKNGHILDKIGQFSIWEPLCCASSEVTVSQVFANESVS